jgi:RimJ/RimL family protein N-acetyltransferase
MKINKIITKRLVLQKFGSKDIYDFAEGLNNLKITKWFIAVPHPYTLKDAKKWCKDSGKSKKDLHLTIKLKDERKVIGAIGIHKIDNFQKTATVGYWINEKYWKKGYGTEALNATLEYAFEKLKLRRIEAGVLIGNPSSGKLLLKFGAIQEGLKRKAIRCKADGKIKDEIIYGILKEDWKKAVKKLNKK